MVVVAKKSKDGHVLNLLFSSEYIISYYCTLTFHITLFKLFVCFLNNVYTHHTSLKKSGRSNSASVSGAQNNKASEPRLFSVAKNSLGTDADEVIYQERMLQALPQKNSLAAAITDNRIYTTESRIRR